MGDSHGRFLNFQIKRNLKKGNIDIFSSYYTVGPFRYSFAGFFITKCYFKPLEHFITKFLCERADVSLYFCECVCTRERNSIGSIC